MTKKKKVVKPTAKKKVVKKQGAKAKSTPAKIIPIPVEKNRKGFEDQTKTGREKFLEKVKLQNDDIFVEAKLEKLSDLTGYKVRKGFSVAVISNNEIVNIVSPTYGLVENQKYFLEVEQQLIEADIHYITRSVNRRNMDFSVDYILTDENYHVNVKGKNAKGEPDRIIPMLRFTNTYGGGPCSGNFGFYREVCSNGLHVAETKVGFKILHRGKTVDIVLPKIKELVEQFLNNEFYSLHKKFKVLAETPIKDLSEFVKYTCTKMNMFKFAQSEKNPTEPSKKAQEILDKITTEAKQLHIEPNLWLGYNAFNGAVHSSQKQTFNRQRKVDTRLFNTVYELVEN